VIAVRDQTGTFASELRHFSRSVDIVNDQVFDRVREIIYKYVRDDLEVACFELMNEIEMANGAPGLQTFWNNRGKGHVQAIRSNGQVSSMMAASFAQRKPLWVISPDKGPLAQAEQYEDQWSGVKDLPKYVPIVEPQTRTLVVVPLQRSRVLGVYYLESLSYVEATSVARHELDLLGEALAILFELYNVNKIQSQHTETAIADLGDALGSAKFPKLPKGKPLVFIAHAHRADPDVRVVIREVLLKFADRVELVFWDQMPGPGNITRQITEKIMKSRYAVCYFSEPVEPDDGSDAKRYIDNPNVIFEAGMLHSLFSSLEGEPAGWIPIREVNSPPAPFDFSQERIIYVPRMVDGEVDETRFRKQLESTVNAMLAEVLSLTRG
jgi:hypothetical protein